MGSPRPGPPRPAMRIVRQHRRWRLPVAPCGSPAAPRDPPAPSAHARAAGGQALPLPRGLGEVDWGRIPPLSASRAAFSRGEPGAGPSSSGPRGCAVYTLQRSGGCALAAGFGSDPFPVLLLVYEALPGSSHPIDRSPVPPIPACWALSTRADAGLR